MNTPDDYDDGYGPPTMEDDAWYTHAVVSLGYPKLRRDPKPAKGQMSIADVIPRPNDDGSPRRVFFGAGFWDVGGMVYWASGERQEVQRHLHVEIAGWYVWDETLWEWVRDENQEPEA